MDAIATNGHEWNTNAGSLGLPARDLCCRGPLQVIHLTRSREAAKGTQKFCVRRSVFIRRAVGGSPRVLLFPQLGHSSPRSVLQGPFAGDSSHAKPRKQTRCPNWQQATSLPSPPQGSLYHTTRSVFSAGPSRSRPHARARDSLASMFSLDGGLPPANHVSDHAGRACGVLLQTSSGFR